jgi:hypothetical protein
MMQPTVYQYVKLGSNLEFLRGICTASLMQTTSLVAFPNLMENLPAQRYSVVRVVEALKAVLVQLQEMKLVESLQAAEPFRPMIQEMEGYLAGVKTPRLARLTDQFAERLVAVSKQVTSVIRTELGTMSASAPPTTADASRT